MDVEDSFQEASDNLVGFLPNLVGFIVAKVVQGIVRAVLDKMSLDRHLSESQANQYVDRVLPGASAASGLARVVFWLIFAFFIFAALGALRIPAVTVFM